MSGVTDTIAAARAYQTGEWCGECRFGVVEDPPCCTRPEPDSDPLLWSVDRSWGRMWREGETPRKFHIDRGDSTAKCSPWILLNALDTTRPIGFGGGIAPDAAVGRLSQVERDMPERVCRRCVPEPDDSEANP